MDLIYKKNQNTIEIIHDLDHQEDNIKQICDIEYYRGISSSYFVRLHAKNYNPFSLKNIDVYKYLISKGHNIGLHFEPNFYTSDATIKEGLIKEIDFLGHMLGLPINRISVHEPARFGSINESIIPKNITYYCYNSSYYKGKKYISDSSASWREGCMCNHITENNNLIILTHPIWWYNFSSAENY
jgi:hypothetical protein